MACLVMAYIVMACMIMAYTVEAYIVMAYIIMAYMIMAYIVRACFVMAHVVVAYIHMACIVMVKTGSAGREGSGARRGRPPCARPVVEISDAAGRRQGGGSTADADCGAAVE